MANASFRDSIFTPDIGLVIIPGIITIQSGGVPISDTLTFASASLIVSGTVASQPAYNGHNKLRINLEHSYVSLKSAQFAMANTGSQGLVCKLSGSSVGTGKYIDVLVGVMSASAGGDAFVLTAPQNTVDIHCLLMLKNSSV